MCNSEPNPMADSSTSRDSQTDSPYTWATTSTAEGTTSTAGVGARREEVKATAALAVAAWEQQVEQDFTMRDAAYKQLKEDLQMRDGEVLNNVDLLVSALASRVDQQVSPFSPYTHSYVSASTPASYLSA